MLCLFQWNAECEFCAKRKNKNTNPSNKSAGCSTPPSTNMQIQKVPTIFSLRKKCRQSREWLILDSPATRALQSAKCRVQSALLPVQSANRVLLPKYLTLPVSHQQCSIEHHCSTAPIVRSLTVQRASAKSAKEIGAEEMHCHWLVTTTLPAKLDEGGWAYQTQSTPCTSHYHHRQHQNYHQEHQHHYKHEGLWAYQTQYSFCALLYLHFRIWSGCSPFLATEHSVLKTFVCKNFKLNDKYMWCDIPPCLVHNSSLYPIPNPPSSPSGLLPKSSSCSRALLLAAQEQATPLWQLQAW